MRKIAVVTVGRSDWGIYLPILWTIQSAPSLCLHLIVSGAHLSPTFGRTVDDIEKDGFGIGDRVDMLLSADTPEAVSKSMGLGMIGLSQVYQRERPDLLLLVGDRFEMVAARLALLPFKIPIAHIHGGEVTTGAIDDAFRHAITKCSHLHFASTCEHARRVIQLGEEPWRVHVSGAPSLDNLRNLLPMPVDELETIVGMSLDRAPLLVTFHPVTLQFAQTGSQIAELLAAIDTFDMPIIVTKPNADTHGQVIIENIVEFARSRKRVRVIDSFGTRGYFSLMSRAAAMVGNSSSGIIEAAAFGLPVVNVGIRQQGRPRCRNVIDVGHHRDEITSGLRRALSPMFRDKLRGLTNIYGDGRAAEYVVERLVNEPLTDRLMLKQFHDLAEGQVSRPSA